MNCCIAAQAVFPWAHAAGRLDNEEFLELMRSANRNASIAQRCTGKDVFDDFATARRVASRGKNRERGCYAYACPVCFRFHVGTRSKIATFFSKRFRRQKRREVV